MTNPNVSVIIPAYNRAATVTKAIDSVLNQTYEDYEIIVVDDGSTDDTTIVLQPYMRRIKYFLQPNKGVSSARNKGVREAKGRLVAFLDSDDLWAPTKLEWQIRTLEQHRDYCMVCFTDGSFFDNHSITTNIFKSAYKKFSGDTGVLDDQVNYVINPPHGIYIQTAIINKDLIDDVQGFDEEMVVAEDTDLIFRLALKTKFCFVNIPLVSIDRAPGRDQSLLGVFDREPDVALSIKEYMYQKWLRLGARLTPKARNIILYRLQGVYKEWANWYLSQSNYPQALLSITKALKLRFNYPCAMKWALIRFAPKISRKIFNRQKLMSAK